MEQNFPNPFNPSTVIQFSLPAEDFVNLSVYNLLGEKVAELVNERMTAGEYKKEFYASGLPAGIYIANLRAGNFIYSIKMALLN